MVSVRGTVPAAPAELQPSSNPARETKRTFSPRARARRGSLELISRPRVDSYP